ncbi:hypothetical protein [Streptomyces sp. NPDC002851]
MQTLALSDASRIIAGVVLLTIVTIEFGGTFLVRVVSGSVPLTDFQKNFARAGHAHAGVLVTLALVVQVLADASSLDGFLGWSARIAVPLAAILMSGGFFASSMGKGEINRPNQFIWILWAGAASLAYGVLTLGIGLLAT